MEKLKNSLFFFLGLSMLVVRAQDVPEANLALKQLNKFHHEKLHILKAADNRDHLVTVARCHEKICYLNERGVLYENENSQPHECTTVKCQVMRLVNQISSNVQALIKLLKPEDLQRIKKLNDDIYQLKMILKRNDIEYKNFDNHPISIYW